MVSEMFEIMRTILTPSSFSIAVTVVGITNIWFLNVHYIAIAKEFPHHLNSFDNVPINHTHGPLVNVTAISTTPKYYYNSINYTAQCNINGFKFNRFSLPLSNNKIMLFMTSLYITTPLTGPFDLTVKAESISEEVYSINATHYNESITKLHFSIMVFDQVDVELSHKYVLAH